MANHRLYTGSVISARSITSTVTSTAFDAQAYDGELTVILDAGAATAGSNPTLDVKVQECATSGGTYTDISGATFTQVNDAAASHQSLVLNVGDNQRYLKVVGTIGGTSSPAFPLAVVVAGMKQYA